jgi:hypothetical protein
VVNKFKVIICTNSAIEKIAKSTNNMQFLILDYIWVSQMLDA